MEAGEITTAQDIQPIHPMEVTELEMRMRQMLPLRLWMKVGVMTMKKLSVARLLDFGTQVSSETVVGICKGCLQLL